MSGKKSRDKGARAERQAISLLSKYWGGKFRRSGSGFDGDDVVESPEDFPWSVEIKDWAEVKTRHLFQPTATLWKFLDQALQQSVVRHRPWMLLVKIERVWYCLTGPTSPEPTSRYWRDTSVMLTHPRYIVHLLEDLTNAKE